MGVIRIVPGLPADLKTEFTFAGFNHFRKGRVILMRIKKLKKT